MMSNIRIASEIRSTAVSHVRNRTTIGSPMGEDNQMNHQSMMISNTDLRQATRANGIRPKTGKPIEINYRHINDLNRHTGNNLR